MGIQPHLPSFMRGTTIIHEHTHVGTGFHCTTLVMAHCPAPNTGIVIVRSVPSALASNLPGLKGSSYHMPPDGHPALFLPRHSSLYSDVHGTFMPQHAASKTCQPILVHFGCGFIGIGVGCLGCPTPSLPSHPWHPPPSPFLPPSALTPPLQKILFSGPRVSAKVVTRIRVR